MGTRADFYVGIKKDEMQYLGSIAMDGFHDTVLPEIVAVDEREYVRKVQSLITSREDGSIPERDGWPWPWENSSGSDYAYTFANGLIWYSRFGDPWISSDDRQATNDPEFPDMTSIKKVTFGKRSGLIVFGI